MFWTISSDDSRSMLDRVIVMGVTEKSLFPTLVIRLRVVAVISELG
jgi:hypothetical protein